MVQYRECEKVIRARNSIGEDSKTRGFQDDNFLDKMKRNEKKHFGSVSMEVGHFFIRSKTSQERIRRDPGCIDSRQQSG